jgi:hypothetical protein
MLYLIFYINFMIKKYFYFIYLFIYLSLRSSIDENLYKDSFQIEIISNILHAGYMRSKKIIEIWNFININLNIFSNSISLVIKRSRNPSRFFYEDQNLEIDKLEKYIKEYKEAIFAFDRYATLLNSGYDNLMTEGSIKYIDKIRNDIRNLFYPVLKKIYNDAVSIKDDLLNFEKNKKRGFLEKLNEFLPIDNFIFDTYVKMDRFLESAYLDYSEFQKLLHHRLENIYISLEIIRMNEFKEKYNIFISDLRKNGYDFKISYLDVNKKEILKINNKYLPDIL